MIGRQIAISWAALTTPGAIKPLDGLRAIAILLVLATHLSLHLPTAPWVRATWLRPVNNGWMGVDLFFVLSGFLIGGTLLRSIANGRFSFRKFYLRRAFRILPAYFAVILVLGLIRICAPDFGRIPAFSFAQVVPNVLLVTDYWQGPIGIPSWSLSIEEHFYLLIPILLVVTRNVSSAARCRWLLSFVFIALLARIIAYAVWDLGNVAVPEDFLNHVYFPFHTRMDALAIGVLVAAIHHERPDGWPESARVVAGALGLLFVGYVGLYAGTSGRWSSMTLHFTVLAVGFGAIVWSVLPVAPVTLLARWLAASFWVPIARLAYAFYVTHLVVFQMVHDPSRTAWQTIPILSASATAVALIVFLLIEAPLLHYAQQKFN